MDISVERAYPTPLANSTLLPMLLLSLATQKHTPETSNEIDTEYDYIVVGAGSAGSVIASRLSEMSCLKVLLLEAGGPPPLLTEVPALSEYFKGTDIDWNFKTVPQKFIGDGLINRQVPYHSGKVLGGSSILNNILYVRGNKKNYDQWAAEGANGWSYKNVFPYFKKMEDNRDENYFLNGFHGEGGPVSIHQPRYRSEFENPLFKTAKAMGYQVVDPNSATQTGFYDIQNTLRSGQRCSTAKAYLVPAENRTNLDILTNAIVRKVLIKNNQAVGVQFDHGNYTYTVKARREVILSAGTVKTAQLLKLSGIGPREELERFNIPVIADLPVGLNFQDHPIAFTNFLLGRDIPQMAKKLEDPHNIHQYIQNRTGPLTSPGINAAAFLKNNVIIPKNDFPDFQLTFAESQDGYPVNTGLNRKYLKQVYKPYKRRSFYTCFCSLLHPKSRGSVTLQSADPYDSPLIDPNYLENPKDIQELVEGVKICMRIGKNPLMRNVGTIPFQTLVPGCEKYTENEDLYIECTIKSAIFSFGHGVGTARMGDPTDPRTVVDPHLKVLHTKGLRVVDASIMPNIPSGDPYIPSIMIAEKASDIIKSAIECIEETQDMTEKAVYPPFYDDNYNRHAQGYSKQKTAKHMSLRQKTNSIRSFEPYNPSPSESRIKKSSSTPSEETAYKPDSYGSRRKKSSSSQSPEERRNTYPSHRNLDEEHWEQDYEANNNLHDHLLHKVTPWNKEIPNVIPWNQEIMRSNVLNILTNQTQSSNPNLVFTGNQQILSPEAGNNFLTSQLTNLFNYQQQQTQGASNSPRPQLQGITNLAQSQTGGTTGLSQPQTQMTANPPQSQSDANTGPSQSFGNVPPVQSSVNPQQQTSGNIAQQQARIPGPELQNIFNSPQTRALFRNPQFLFLLNNLQKQATGNKLQSQSPNNILQNPNSLQGRIPFDVATLLQITNNQPLSASNTFHSGNFKTQNLDNTRGKKQWNNLTTNSKPSNKLHSNSQGKKQGNDESSPWQSVWTRTHSHVLPWNKEIPNVTPWNQEIRVSSQLQPITNNQQMQQMIRPNAPNQMINGIQNAGQGTSASQSTDNSQQSQEPSNSGQATQTQSAQSQTNGPSQMGNDQSLPNEQQVPIPANLVESLRQLQQNIETQIAMLTGRQQSMQNLLGIVQQMLNLLSSNPSMIPSVRRSDVNFESPQKHKEICDTLLESMQCGDISCQGGKALSTYMHSQLCA